MPTEFALKQHDIFKVLRNMPVIPELTEEIKPLEFLLSSAEEVLHPVIEENDVIIVAGSYFGDEGKGKITDAIARDPLIKLVVRYNSGENAGHTVYHDGKKFVFHLTPSAVTLEDKVCAIGPECVMDPVSFMKEEVGQLVREGINYKDRLFVGNAHIVTPYHKILDFIVNPSNSSTLKGMSPSHISKVWKRGLRLDDLFNSEKKQRENLETDIEIYFAFLKQRGLEESEIAERFKEMEDDGREVPQHIYDFLEAEDKVNFLIKLYRENVVENEAFPQRADITDLTNKTLESKGKVLIECPQSYWLSNATEKHWRSSTSAQTHAMGVFASGLIHPRYRKIVFNVGKTPGDSRVGRGANPAGFVNQTYFSDQSINSLDDLGDACINFDGIQRLYFRSIQENGILQPTTWVDETGAYSISEAMAIACSRHFGEKGATTGKPRITGTFDCVAAYHVNKAQGPNLVISALDRADDQDSVGLTVAYAYHHPEGEIIDSNGIKYRNGDIIRSGDPLPYDPVLKYCYPIIKVLPGWKDTPIAASKRASDTPLPQNVQNFLANIEHFTGFNVVAIGNGQNTRDMIYLKKHNPDLANS